MEDKKPGTTRFMLYAGPVVLVVLGAVVIMYAALCMIQKNDAGLKELALLAIGSLIVTLAGIVGYYFGKNSVS